MKPHTPPPIPVGPTVKLTACGPMVRGPKDFPYAAPHVLSGWAITAQKGVPCLHIHDVKDPIVRDLRTRGGWMGILIERCQNPWVELCDIAGYSNTGPPDDREGHGIQFRDCPGVCTVRRTQIWRWDIRRYISRIPGWGETGISAYHSNVRIIENTIQGHGESTSGNAIDFDQDSSGEATGNRIITPGPRGIGIFSGPVRVDGNYIDGATDAGIAVQAFYGPFAGVEIGSAGAFPRCGARVKIDPKLPTGAVTCPGGIADKW